MPGRHRRPPRQAKNKGAATFNKKAAVAAGPVGDKKTRHGRQINNNANYWTTIRCKLNGILHPLLKPSVEMLARSMTQLLSEGSLFLNFAVLWAHSRGLDPIVEQTFIRQAFTRCTTKGQSVKNDLIQSAWQEYRLAYDTYETPNVILEPVVMTTALSASLGHAVQSYLTNARAHIQGLLYRRLVSYFHRELVARIGDQILNKKDKYNVTKALAQSVLTPGLIFSDDPLAVVRDCIRTALGDKAHIVGEFRISELAFHVIQLRELVDFETAADANKKKNVPYIKIHLYLLREAELVETKVCCLCVACAYFKINS